MTNWPTKKLGNMNRSEIEGRIFNALDQLYKNDTFLLEHAAHERSISHKLGEYLQVLFPGWHVDCEYNLHGIETKKLPRECRGQPQERVFPDIIIHHRNTDHNLLVIEIKPNRKEQPDECDNAKLLAFTNPSGEYKYQAGLFIGFNGINEPQLAWYQTGKRA